MKKNIAYLILICLVPLILYLLSLETVVPIPPDEQHIGIDQEIRCFDCHGEGKENARSPEHPPKDRCFKCHRITEERHN